MRYKDDKYSLMCVIPPTGRKYFMIFVNDTEFLRISGFYGFYHINRLFSRITKNEPIEYKKRYLPKGVILKKIHTFDTWNEFLNFENSHPEYFI